MMSIPERKDVNFADTWALTDLPPLILGKQNPEQIWMCYQAYRAREWEPRFD